MMKLAPIAALLVSAACSENVTPQRETTRPASAAAAAPSATASVVATLPAEPKIEPVLDADKGKRAVAAYVSVLTEICKAPDKSAKLTTIGLKSDELLSVCDPPPSAAALASGAFVEQGADEVLLVARSGRDRAEGDHTLALMRRTGGTYKLVRHMLKGKGFEARARVTFPKGRDGLLLCQDAGNQGYYPSTCGFLGQGSFRPDTDAGDPKNEFDIVHATTCGPVTNVTMGNVTLAGGRMSIELVVEKSVLEPKDATETAFCSKKKNPTRETFKLEYALEGTSFRRLTAIPKQVTDAFQ
jgi:hypothetical protein